MFHSIVPFVPQKDGLLLMDFTAANHTLSSAIMSDTTLFCQYITRQLAQQNALYGIGGYGEHRTLYSVSKVFDALHKTDQPRRLHLGVDIWGKPGTPVFAPLGGVVHSFAFNSEPGDYGATLVLLHQLSGTAFYTLYGHLSLSDLANLQEGKYVSSGERIGHFGEPHENGNWPPHLHFQVIKFMEGKWGDYPGVCADNEKEKYLHNCPDPDLILGMMKYAKTEPN